ncbi:sensor histidine kinase [Chryseobacterium sp. IT-36CA2]|uniref:sensor histidine kinase n=1 Tax=Chryseobacterium sp. IT-36CA2 TaxID=3026460 RepID=UPI0039E06FA2
MKKKFRSVFLIASATACCILVFQVYWAFNTYKTAEENLNAVIGNTLKKSVEIYQLKQLDSIPVIRKDDQRIYYATKKWYIDSTKKNKDYKKEPPYKMIIDPIEISQQQLPVIKNMILQLKASTLKSIDLKELTYIVQQEFARNEIDLQFDLSLSKKQVPLKNVFYIPVQLSKDNILIKARITNSDVYLMKQNLVPLSISLILILLSAGSYYFMALTIKRQLKLDHLKNDFINNMTHELRTPITILKSSNDALLNFNAINDPDRAEKYLKINGDILSQLEHNVDRILDIAQYNNNSVAVPHTKVKLNELITTVITRFSIHENVDIQYINQLDNDEFYTDPFILDTILSNLLDNSIKYAREKAQVILKISPTENGFQLYVEDNGKGIDSIYLPYIFDKFFRVPEDDNLHSVKGYGLGLNYVKELVDSLKGTLDVKSRLGSGTIFIINFPAI